jgi:hypothetical protein
VHTVGHFYYCYIKFVYKKIESCISRRDDQAMRIDNQGIVGQFAAAVRYFTFSKVATQHISSMDTKRNMAGHESDQSPLPNVINKDA